MYITSAGICSSLPHQRVAHFGLVSFGISGHTTTEPGEAPAVLAGPVGQIVSLATGEAGPCRREIQFRHLLSRARAFEPPAASAVMGDGRHERYPVVIVLTTELVLQPQQSRAVTVYGGVEFDGGTDVIALSPAKRALLPSRQERADARQVADGEDQALLYATLSVALKAASPPAHTFPHSPKSIEIDVGVPPFVFRPNVVDNLDCIRAFVITRFTHPYPFHLSARP